MATNVSLRDAELTISLSFDASSLFTSLSVAILAKATFLSSSNFAFSFSAWALAAASFSNLSFSRRSASAFWAFSFSSLSFSAWALEAASFCNVYFSTR